MHLVTLDTEQAAILVDAAEASLAFLGHRLQRADPEQILSKSYTLQRRKIDQVKHQLSLSPIPEFSAISADRQKLFRARCKQMCEARSAEKADHAFTQLLSMIMEARHVAAQATTDPQSKAPVVIEAIAPGDAPRRTGKSPALRKVPNKTGKGDPPSLAASAGRS